MKTTSDRTRWFRRYRAALREHLRQGLGASLQSALELGRQAAAMGLATLDVAKFHRQALKPLVSPRGSPGTRQKTIERARSFFAETIVPIENTHHAALKNDVLVHRLTQTLRRRTLESSAVTRGLKRSILERRGAEKALKKSGIRHARILAELHRLQRRLRDLTHTWLSNHEDEREQMSLRLHDEVAQALIAIDIRLLTLKKAARASTAHLKKEIASTQRLVKESAKRIDRFAHEFGIRHKA